MAIRFEQLETLLVGNQINKSTVSLVLSYLELKQKVDKPGGQSWYFNKGLEGSKIRLKIWEKRYEEIRNRFNNTTLDELIEEINEKENKMGIMRQNGMGTCLLIAYSSFRNTNRFLSELVGYKSKTDLLVSLKEFEQNPEQLILLME